MPAINIDALFIGEEDWEGNDGSSVATEDEDNTDMEVGGYAHDFLEVILLQLWEGCFGRRRTTMKTMETRRDDEHEKDVVMRSMFVTLCEGKPMLSSSTGLKEVWYQELGARRCLLERPHPPSAGTTKSQRRVGTRKRPELAIVR